MSLAARARAELVLWYSRTRGQDLEWTGKPPFYEGWPIFRAEGPISLGLDCRIYGGVVRTRLIARPTGRIEIGDCVGINFGTGITSVVRVTIGDHSRIGPNVTIYDTGFHPVSEGDEPRTAPVTIGEDVWVGRQALILPGVEIGDHSVIAAGSVISRDVPERTIVAGNPAQPVGNVRASEHWWRD